MYRIEVSPGEETVLRTIEELSTAIRNGLVSRRSRIFHSASQKWLPIEFHPHYKKALEGSTATPARVEGTPTPAKHAPSPGKHTPPPAKHAPSPAPLPTFAHPVYLDTHPVDPAPEYREPETTIRFRRRSRRRPLELALAGVAIIVGTQVVLSAATPSEESAAPVAFARRPAAQPIDSTAVSVAASAATPAIDGAPLSTVAPASTPTAGPSAPVVPVAVAPRPSVKPALVPKTATAPALVPAAAVRSAPTPPLLPGTKPSPAAGSSSQAGIEPAPAELNLALPALLPGSDSISAVAKPPSDSNAIRRILRAVSGGKTPPANPSTP